MSNRRRIAILFPASAGERTSIKLAETRHAPVAAAISALGVEVEGAPFADAAVADVRAQLLRVDGVLVWYNPSEHGRDRTVLNAMLSEVAEAGVYISAHPDVIQKMGTKEVLYRTQTMSWGCDTRHYPTQDEMRSRLPVHLVSGDPRILKQVRGSSGDGVWKVELAAPPQGDAAQVLPTTTLRVRHAKRGNAEETLSLERFLERCVPYFAAGGSIIDQAYQPRITDGMIRCYLVGDRVAGFGEQLVNALYPAPAGRPALEAPTPGPRLYYPPTRPDFQRLKIKLELEWVGELCSTLALKRSQLPVLWDADFLYGPRDAAGADTYVLCEINVSSVHPFPDDAIPFIAAETLDQIDRLR